MNNTSCSPHISMPTGSSMPLFLFQSNKGYAWNLFFAPAPKRPMRPIPKSIILVGSGV